MIWSLICLFVLRAPAADSTALALIDEGRLDEAVEALHLARARRPDDLNLMYLMARTLRQAGQSGLAESMAETVIGRDSTHRAARVLFAGLLAEREHWTGARDAYRDLVAADSTNPLFRYRLAEAYQMLELPAPALAELREAHRLGPKNLVVLHDLIRLEYALDSLDAAEAHGRLALELAPNHIPFRKRLGEIAFRRKRHAEAAEHYRMVVDLGDRSAPSWRNLGMSLYFADRVDASIEALTEAARVDAEDPNTRFYLAMALVAADRAEEALPHLDAAITASRGPLMVDGYVQKGVLLDRLRRREESVAAYDLAIRLQPDRTDIWYFTAAAYDRDGTRKRQAREYYQRYLDAPGEKDPNLVNYARRRVSVLTEELHFGN